ncbi:hypothetical protein N9N28_03975 [Rubripirellula amarantea]|uniref:Uncharacterized protein n=1 Tax=Rubripirellula amarantea TaxID=2527999 RepID=A0A5C5WVG4_9BACT|nr:hypothetical protein [Rubripirellula amarantea]MDA8743775.1 hypothetical protein [Rubripirellula amarantea]TWT54646.1 hypothetical protein Pla22_22960 [Rubripirellula amarantea]
MSTSTNNPVQVQANEPDAHLVARHFRTGVRLLLSLSLIATIVCLFFLQEAAYLAAIPIPLLYAVLAFTNYLEMRSRASQLRPSKSSGIGREEIEVDIETVGVVTLLKVFGVLAIGSFIVAASFFDWKMVGIGATALFFLVILIQMPFLPLYFSEAERDELRKVRKS